LFNIRDFVEGIPLVIIEKDQTIAILIVQLPNMGHDEMIAVAERLLWTHQFEVTAVVDAIEELLMVKSVVYSSGVNVIRRISKKKTSTAKHASQLRN
jgi:hypothetical protein